MLSHTAGYATASNVEKKKKKREEEDEDKNSGPLPWPPPKIPDMPLTCTHALLRLQLWHKGHVHHSLLLFTLA